jgi:hypothetical protein
MPEALPAERLSPGFTAGCTVWESVGDKGVDAEGGVDGDVDGDVDAKVDVGAAEPVSDVAVDSTGGCGCGAR